MMDCGQVLLHPTAVLLLGWTMNTNPDADLDTALIASFKYEVPIDPSVLTTAQEKGVRIVKGRNGKCFPSFFKKAKAVQNEKMLMGVLKKYRPYEHPIVKTDNTYIVLSIDYYFPHKSSTPEWKRKFNLPMTNRPDVDNISKAVIDCMTKCGFWEDDSQLSLRLAKFRSQNPRIEIGIDIFVVDALKEKST